MPDPKARKGLLDGMDELERRRAERKSAKKPAKTEDAGLDLDKVW